MRGLMIIVGFMVAMAICPVSADAQQKINPVYPKTVNLDWSGKYVAGTDVGSTAGGTGIAYDIVVTLKKSGKLYVGTMTVDGWQTGIQCKVKGYPYGRRIKIFCDGVYGISQDFEPKDTPICEFHFSKDRRLTADWFLCMEYYVNDETDFRKVK